MSLVDSKTITCFRVSGCIRPVLHEGHDTYSTLGIRGQPPPLPLCAGSTLLTSAETPTQLAKDFESHFRLLIDRLLKFFWAEHQHLRLLLGHGGARPWPPSQN